VSLITCHIITDKTSSGKIQISKGVLKDKDLSTFKPTNTASARLIIIWVAKPRYLSRSLSSGFEGFSIFIVKSSFCSYVYHLSVDKPLLANINAFISALPGKAICFAKVKGRV
jgi:hypothetical protein